MRCVTLSVWIGTMTACGTVEGSEAGLDYTPCDVLSETTVTEGAASVYGLAPIDEVLSDLTGSFDLSLDRIDGGAPGPYPGTLTVSLGAGDIVAQERAMPSGPSRLPPEEDCGPVYQVPFLTALDLEGGQLSVAAEQRLEVRDAPEAQRFYGPEEDVWEDPAIASGSMDLADPSTGAPPSGVHLGTRYDDGAWTVSFEVLSETPDATSARIVLTSDAP